MTGSLRKQKWFFCGIAVKNLLSTFIFKSVLQAQTHLQSGINLWFMTQIAEIAHNSLTLTFRFSFKYATISLATENLSSCFWGVIAC